MEMKPAQLIVSKNATGKDIFMLDYRVEVPVTVETVLASMALLITARHLVIWVHLGRYVEESWHQISTEHTREVVYVNKAGMGCCVTGVRRDTLDNTVNKPRQQPPPPAEPPVPAWHQVALMQELHPRVKRRRQNSPHQIR
jgi:hypothetical protein